MNNLSRDKKLKAIYDCVYDLCSVIRSFEESKNGNIHLDDKTANNLIVAKTFLENLYIEEL